MWRGAVCGEEHGFCEADMSTPRAYKAEGARANTVAGWVAMRTTQHLLWFAEAPHGMEARVRPILPKGVFGVGP